MTEKWIKVSDCIIHDSYTNFTKIFYPDKSGVGLYFWNFLGVPHGPRHSSAPKFTWVIPEIAAEKARMLAGPHYQTIAKAMIATGHNPYREIGSDGDH